MYKISVNLQGIERVEGKLYTEESNIYLPAFDGEVLEEISLKESPGDWESNFDMVWDFRGCPEIDNFETFHIHTIAKGGDVRIVDIISNSGKFDEIHKSFNTPESTRLRFTIDEKVVHPNKGITILPNLRIRFDDSYEYLGGPKGVQSLDAKTKVILGHKGEIPGTFYKSDIDDVRNEILENITNLPDGTTIQYNDSGKLEAIGGGGGISNVTHDTTLVGDGTTNNVLSVSAKNLADGDFIKQFDWKGNFISIDTTTLCNAIVANNTLAAGNGTISVPFVDNIKKDEDTSKIIGFQLKTKGVEGSEAYVENYTETPDVAAVSLNLWIDKRSTSLKLERKQGDLDGGTLITKGLKPLDWDTANGNAIPTVNDINAVVIKNIDVVEAKITKAIERASDDLTHGLHNLADNTTIAFNSTANHISLPYVQNVRVAYVNNKPNRYLTFQTKAEGTYYNTAYVEYDAAEQAYSQVKMDVRIEDADASLTLRKELGKKGGTLIADGLLPLEWSTANDNAIPTVKDVKNYVPKSTNDNVDIDAKLIKTIKDIKEYVQDSINEIRKELGLAPKPTDTDEKSSHNNFIRNLFDKYSKNDK